MCIRMRTRRGGRKQRRIERTREVKPTLDEQHLRSGVETKEIFKKDIDENIGEDKLMVVRVVVVLRQGRQYHTTPMWQLREDVHLKIVTGYPKHLSRTCTHSPHRQCSFPTSVFLAPLKQEERNATRRTRLNPVFLECLPGVLERAL